MGIQHLPVSPSSTCSTPDYVLSSAINLPEPDIEPSVLTSLTPEANKQQKIIRHEKQLCKEHNSDQFPHGSDEVGRPDQRWQTQGRKLRRVNGSHREDRRLLSAPSPADCIIFPPAPPVAVEMKRPATVLVPVPAAGATFVSVPPGFTPGKDNDMKPIGVKKQNRYELLYSSEIKAFKETDNEKLLPSGIPIIDKLQDTDVAHSSKFEIRDSTIKPIPTSKTRSKKHRNRNRKGKNVNIPDPESLKSCQQSSCDGPIVAHGNGAATIANELGLLIITDPPKLDPSESLFQSTASTLLQNDDFNSLQIFYVDTILQLGRRFEEFQDSILRIHGIMADLCVQHDQLDAALDILRNQILSKELQLYGTDHLETLATHLCIASIYDYLHRWEEAAELHKQISKIFERVYGEDDERTIDAEHHYAVALHNERKGSNSNEAIHIFRKVFIKSKQVLGHDHGKTLKYGYNLAIALHSDGNLDESYKLFHTISEKYKKKPTRLAIIKIFAIACQSRKARIWLDRGKARASIKMFQTIVQDLTQILGKDHPVTVSETNKLVRAHLAAGHREIAGRISLSLNPNERETEDVNGEIIRQRAYFNIDVHKTIRGKVLGTLTPSLALPPPQP